MFGLLLFVDLHAAKDEDETTSESGSDIDSTTDSDSSESSFDKFEEGFRGECVVVVVIVVVVNYGLVKATTFLRSYRNAWCR